MFLPPLFILNISLCLLSRKETWTEVPCLSFHCHFHMFPSFLPSPSFSIQTWFGAAALPSPLLPILCQEDMGRTPPSWAHPGSLSVSLDTAIPTRGASATCGAGLSLQGEQDTTSMLCGFTLKLLRSWLRNYCIYIALMNSWVWGMFLLVPML